MQCHRPASASFAWVKLGLVVFVTVPLLGIFTLTVPESEAQTAKAKGKTTPKDKAAKDKPPPKAGQDRGRCGAHQLLHEMKKTSAEFRKAREQLKTETAKFVAARTANITTALRTTVITIPVVVHVVHNTADQNVPDSRIKSQIAVLNADYRRRNADRSKIPAVFQKVAADARIEFRLAVRDPAGKATTGITRTKTKVTFFRMVREDVKFNKTGGHDAWPRDKYLNIWVCPLEAGLAGYGLFPGSSPRLDGVVLGHDVFGVGSSNPRFNLGRTATHEVGHWLNLRHIWGDDGQGCTGSDRVADTPNQGGPNFNKPTFPRITCRNGPDGDMFMNFMDYCDDDNCQMFTLGQVVRMDATLFGPRKKILTSDALIPPGVIAGADLWAKDGTFDFGAEPNKTAVPWESPDIWVRNQKDGQTFQQHENPKPGKTNYVYVRIRNRGNTGGTGTVKLYWAKASTALSWPKPWDGSVTKPAKMGGLIGSKSTGTVVTGGGVILEFPWIVPAASSYKAMGADKSHFSLLARLETSTKTPFGMKVAETADLLANVKNNNNIVGKCVSIMEDGTGGPSGSVTVGNLDKKATPCKLRFDVPLLSGRVTGPARLGVFQDGEFRIDLGAKLAAKVQKAVSLPAGLKLSGSVLTCTVPGALPAVTLDPGELHTIKLQFVPKSRANKPPTVYRLFVIQSAPAPGDDRVVAGHTFTIKVGTVKRDAGK